jgi:serine/threonine protein kinase/tetratricopeptide (TPR) repeat protein
LEERVTAAGPFSIGDVVDGRYQIQTVVGRGGHGVVYAATQLATGQTVALKALHGHLTYAVSRARFAQELKLVAQLRHPRIVQLLDAGQVEDRPYTVFEFVEGQTLADYIRTQGGLAAVEAKRLMVQLLEALHAAHEQGVIHRDLKPQNIMVSVSGGRLQARLLDFGIATLTGNAADDTPSLTLTGEVLGTPAYMAPEQLRGDMVGPKTDLFAMGLVLIECLTSVRAVQGTSMADILFQQLSDAAVPIPQGLEAAPLGAILARATAKEPSQRYATALEMLEAIEGCDVTGVPRLQVLQAQRPALVPTLDTTLDNRLQSPSLSPSVSPSTRERRRLTVAFLGLANAEELGSLDPEDFDDLLATYHRSCAQHIEEMGGTLVRYAGDSLLACFGFPHAREDDARRAVTAARRIVDGVATWSTPFPLRIKVAIHTGDLVASADDSGVSMVGPTLRTVARMHALAPPSAVVVSEDTRELVEGWFTCSRVDAADAVGISGELYQVHAKTSARDRLDVARTTTPLVGRRHELALLDARWQQACDGRGQALVISGEAGIGKSRVIREFRLAMEGEATWLTCRGSQQASQTSFHPIRELLTGVPGSELLHDDAPRLDMSPQRRRQEMMDAAIAAVATLSDDGPLVCFVEDAQWADPSTIELLGLLVDACRAFPCLVLVTARQTVPLQGPNVTQLPLPPLNRVEVATVVRAVAGDGVPESMVDAVVDKAGGVPLFAEEIAKAVMAGDDDRVPTTLNESLMARLDGVGPAKAIAQLGAVFGLSFRYQDLAHVAGIPEAELTDSLATLVAANLLLQRGRPPSSTYIYRQALLRDAAYATVLRRTRKAWHAAVAEVLVAQAPNTPPEAIARHYTAAEQPELAIRFWQQAGERALTASALVESVELLHAGLAVIETMTQSRDRQQLEFRLRCTLGVPLMLTKGYGAPQVEQTYARARELCEAVGDEPQLFGALWGLWQYYHVRGDYLEAEELGKRLFQLAQTTGNTGILLGAHQALGATRFLRGNLDRALEHFELALQVYDVSLHAPLAFVFGQDGAVFSLSHLGWLHWHRGDPVQAESCVTRALALCAQLQQPSSFGFAEHFAAVLQLHLGHHDQARQHALRVQSLAFEQGMPHWHALASVVLGWVKTRQGQALEAIPMIEAGLTGLDQAGSRVANTYWQGALAEAKAAAGQPAQAKHVLEGAFEFIEQSDERFYEAALKQQLAPLS